MMRALGLRKSLYLPLTAFLIVLCFFLYHNSGLVELGHKRVIMLKPPSTFHSQRQQLVQVLRRATMQDRSVILTMVNESWARHGSILEVFLQSFKSGLGTQRLLNHLVIIAMDLQAFNYCKSLHTHCIHPSTFAYYFVTKRQSITNPHHNVFSWRRNILLEVLQLGYSIIFTDADVLWLRNPLSNFSPSGYSLTMSCNFSSDGQGRGYVQDGGIFFLKSNAIAIEFFKYWKLSTFLYPNSYAEESMCATIMQSKDIVEAYSFLVKYVDTTYFGGFCQLSKDMLRKAHTIHANCCGDLTSKVHDLRNVLDDWIHLRERVSGDNTSYKMAYLRWPQKCTRQKST